MMEQVRMEFVLEARQPISHTAESLGNTSVIMRQKVRQRDGSWAHVPIVTGDTMRHGLREAASYCLLDCAGLLGENLTEEALRLLFAGGMVTGSSGSSINLDEYREMVELIPSLALLGGCVQNRVIPGRMQVDTAVLVCEETAHLVPEWVAAWLSGQSTTLDSCRSHVEEVQRVRMDPSLDPAKRLLLTEGARAHAEGRMLASEAASASDDAVAKAENKSTMMPFRYERVAQGSLFFWGISAMLYSELDRDTLLTMVGAFVRAARVGGKRGTGHGLLVPLIAKDVALASLQERAESLDLAGPEQRTGHLFRAHVKERSEKLRAFLERVAA